jgi:hypothetical protein
MVVYNYDLAVVGDHLGGLTAAAMNVRRGRRVLLLENTEESSDRRPLEYLNAICGGPDRESGLGTFFHEIGLSPFGPLGDDRIHFRPLLPPLQVIQDGHRTNIYQDRVARNWELEREFGNVQDALNTIQKMEEEFRERLYRFGQQRETKKGGVRRVTKKVGRYVRLKSLQREAEKLSLKEFLQSLSLDPELAGVMAGQVYGAARTEPSSLPWAVGLRAIGALQGGLFQNASGLSGILRGLKEAFVRYGGDVRPLLSLEGIDSQRGEAATLQLSAAGDFQADQVVIDLPLDSADIYLSKEMKETLRKRGLRRTQEEGRYGILRLPLKRSWAPECMGSYLVVDPSLERGGQKPTLLAAAEPGGKSSEPSSFALEVLGLFDLSADADPEEYILERMARIMPFLKESLEGEPDFAAGPYVRYHPQDRSWSQRDVYYRTGRLPSLFRLRKLTFLRNEDYITTGLAEGIFSGIAATS